ncbi:hypothetical protein AB0M94_37520 [Streptomyces xanthochromogenes]|uniref:hypothetical protein n=1 Tax=Streptomyces TaxID=1883 RepID=UPI00136F4B8D|nr:hypothetical protein [Streptomyces sp. SID1034]MYV89723.1 hypothetical protein [Streptomyces sp. SID1034]
MSTPRRRPLGAGRGVPEIPALSPLPERAAASTWVEAPSTASPTVRIGRRRLGTGLLDPGG